MNKLRFGTFSIADRRENVIYECAQCVSEIEINCRFRNCDWTLRTFFQLQHRFDSNRDFDPMTIFSSFYAIAQCSLLASFPFIKFRSHSTIRKVNRYWSYWALELECNITCDCMRCYQCHFVWHRPHISSKPAVKWWVQTNKFSVATKNTLNVYCFWISFRLFLKLCGDSWKLNKIKTLLPHHPKHLLTIKNKSIWFANKYHIKPI